MATGPRPRRHGRGGGYLENWQWFPPRWTLESLGTGPGGTDREAVMECKIELIFVPVTDVDRAIDFYDEKVGFTLDMGSTGG